MGAVKLVALRDFSNAVGIVEFGQIFEADSITARKLVACGDAGTPGPRMSAVLMASGPSLVPEDVELVRAWREATPGAKVFVTNLTFRMAPWADVMYALDGLWWRAYGPEVAESFKGEMWTPCEAACQMFGAHLVTMRKRAIGLSKNRGVVYGCNSGRHLIDLAYHLGAGRMVLLGYDMGPSSTGREHWHEAYPDTVQMRPAYRGWTREFGPIAGDLKARGVKVLNCSRRSAITAFEMASLEDGLARFSRPGKP